MKRDTCTELFPLQIMVWSNNGSRQMRSNTTVSLMSTVFYTVSFCSLWKFLLKIAKNKVLCKDVRFFETWNALINRLDEINFKVLYSLNTALSREFFKIFLTGEGRWLRGLEHIPGSTRPQVWSLAWELLGISLMASASLHPLKTWRNKRLIFAKWMRIKQKGFVFSLQLLTFLPS